jgi:hypothetical protein
MTFHYDIHSLVTLVSDVPLAQLAPFARPVSIDHPALRIRVGKRRARRRRDAADEIVVYEEVRGLGFAVRIALGEPIEVDASPLSRHSPHVLYTTVVEPILRWTFVRRGWALVHGACVANGNDAYLIRAQTDTRRTATLLTLLRRYPRLSFLADDHCLVDPDGNVLAYPKPMSISRHSLGAFNARALSWRERAALEVQSRVHSRSGRRLAHGLARAGVPVATLDTVVQWLVPPAEYPVERLLPYAGLATGAVLRGLFLIERGAVDSTRQLGHETAMEKLAADGEGASALPLSSLLESRLRGWGGRDWGAREREIVASAFAGRGAVLLASARPDWWRRIGSSIEASIARSRPATASLAFA